jgi:hypothetical protein
MEQRWNDTDRGKQKDRETNLSQYHYTTIFDLKTEAIYFPETLVCT